MDPSARRLLQSLAAAGVRRMPLGAGRTPDSAAAPAASGSGIPAVAAPAPPRPARPEAEARRLLDDLAAEVARCQACPLCQTRTRTVPGEGHAAPRVVFVGEGPGADEDRTGRPFVGKAGQLLDDIITKGMRLRREDVFICNVVKCRPPGNRTPEPGEVQACAGFLERQLLALAPRVICALGAVAAQALLATDEPVGRLRGRVGQWRGIPVIPTYHPAYLLRNPAAKRPTWEDIQRVMERSGGP